jgi:ketosteroid isomerase-like protein
VDNEEAAAVRGAFEAMAKSVGASPEESAALTERWFHPDVEYSEDAKWPGSTTYRGRDLVRRTFEGYAEILGGEIKLEEVIQGSDGLFARVRYRGTSTGADIPWEQTWGYHCRVRDGQLSYFKAYSDVEEALAAAGVSSSSP